MPKSPTKTTKNSINIVWVFQQRKNDLHWFRNVYLYLCKSASRNRWVEVIIRVALDIMKCMRLQRYSLHVPALPPCLRPTWLLLSNNVLKTNRLNGNDPKTCYQAQVFTHLKPILLAPITRHVLLSAESFQSQLSKTPCPQTDRQDSDQPINTTARHEGPADQGYLNLRGYRRALGKISDLIG